MKPTSEKKHRHKYDKIVEWIKAPSHPDDVDVYWHFKVNKSCECGEKRKYDAEPNEVREYIKNLSCSSCGSFNMKHESQSDCIRDLHLRVQFLEDRLEKVCDALSGIGR